MKKFILNDALSFLSVVAEGSFAAAAKKWGVSPSVISKRITRLETDLGVQLLQRTTRKLALTEVGQNFYDRCERIESEINEAATLVSESQQAVSGTLRINAPMSFGHRHLISAARDFMQEYPAIQIELLLGSQFSNLIDHSLDLAIYVKEVPNTHALKARRVALRHTGIYGTRDYFERHSTPKTPADLKQHNCLIFQSEHGHMGASLKHEWLFYDGKTELHIPVAGNMKANSNEALARACLAGVGIARLSSFMVTDEIKSGKLVSVLNRYCPRDIAIHAVYPNQRHLPHKLSVFIDFLVSRFDLEDYWDKTSP
jgi:DNA-binding transcriptional LysR family regulator